MRQRVLRIARARPDQTSAQLAAAVGCHPSTVRKHLRTVRLTRRPAAVCVEAASLEQLTASPHRAAADRLRWDGDLGGEARQSRDPVLLARLAADRAWWVRQGVASNPATPAHALELLAGPAWDPVWPGREKAEMCARVAANPGCPPRLAARLAALCCDLPTRTAAVANPNCPARVIRLLAGSRQADLRGAAAGNPSSPPDALIRLAHDSSETVCEKVAANPSAPWQAVRHLAAAGTRAMRDVVAQRPDCPAAALTVIAAADGWTQTLERVARHPNCPPEAFAAIADSSDDRGRRAAAVQPNCPQMVLDRFAEDPDWRVRCGAGRNPSCPPETVAALAGDSDGRVRQAITTAPNLPDDALDRLAADLDPEVRAFALVAVRVRRDPDSVPAQDSTERHRAALHPLCPPSLLARLADDPDEDIRQSAVAHPSCPPGTLVHVATEARSVVENRDSSLHQRDIAYHLLRLTAKNPGCPPELRTKLNRRYL